MPIITIERIVLGLTLFFPFNLDYPFLQNDQFGSVMNYNPDNRRRHWVATVGLSLLCSIACVAFTGCGLLGGPKKPNVESVPAYYSQKTVPIEKEASNGFHYQTEQDPDLLGPKDPNPKYAVSSKQELEKLEREAAAFEEERARLAAEKKPAEKSEKKSFWGWFSSGDRMTGMSPEAKELNRSLDAKREIPNRY